MRIIDIVEARMLSTRLPGKVMKTILGRPTLELMIERLRRVSHLDDIVVATTVDPSCDPIVELCHKLGVGCFRGSEEDVLDRVMRAAQEAKADIIVETTGDCPLIDPETTDSVIRTFLDNDVDYCSNNLEHTYPLGMEVKVFPLAVLEEVDRLTDSPADREHVSLYIYEHPEKYRCLNFAGDLPPEDAELRLVLDNPEDFELISKVFEALYPNNPAFSLRDMLDLFNQHSQWRDINRHIQPKPLH